jgi:tryptophan-rich sensory protein
MTETLYPWNREVFGVIFSIIALILGFTSISARGRNQKDRAYYDAIRANVKIAPPNMIFGPVWSVLILLFTLNMIFYFISPRSWTPHHADTTLAVAIIFVGWLVAYAAWTFLFFTIRATWIAFVDSLLLLALSIALLILQIQGGETRWWVTWLCYIPIILWTAFASVLTAMVAIRTKNIAMTNARMIETRSVNQ